MSFDSHIAIVAAVKTRDRELARQAMHDHFETWNQQTMRSFPKAEGAGMFAE